MAIRKAKKGAKKTTPRRSVAIPSTVRGMLDVIDRFLARRDNAGATYGNGYGRSGELWNVLTALRGPDFGGVRMKDNTTVPIRRAAFPRTTKLEDDAAFRVPADFGRRNKAQEVVLDYTVVSDIDNTPNRLHFLRHAGDAARVLGLIVKSSRDE